MKVFPSGIQRLITPTHDDRNKIQQDSCSDLQETQTRVMWYDDSPYLSSSQRLGHCNIRYSLEARSGVQLSLGVWMSTLNGRIPTWESKEYIFGSKKLWVNK